MIRWFAIFAAVYMTWWGYFVQTANLTPGVNALLQALGWMTHVIGLLLCAGITAIIYQLTNIIQQRKAKRLYIRSINRKFPDSYDLRWHPKTHELKRSIRRESHVYLVGPHGSGKRELAIYLLRELGFPGTFDEGECYYVHVEFRGHSSLNEALDSFLIAVGASPNSAQSTQAKIEIIRGIAQKARLAVLLQDIDALSESERRQLHAFIQSLPRGARVFVTSCVKFPSDIAITEHEIEPLSKNLIFKYAKAIRTETPADIQSLIPDLQKVTKGHFGCITWALVRARDRTSLGDLIQQLRSGRGALTTVIQITFNELSNGQKTVFALVSKFGGMISNRTLYATLRDEESNLQELLTILARTPLISVIPDPDAGFILIPKEISELVSGANFSIPTQTIRDWLQRLVLWYKRFDETSNTADPFPSFDHDVSLVEGLMSWAVANSCHSEVHGLYSSTCELLFNRGFFESRIRNGAAAANALASAGETCRSAWILSSYGSVCTLIGDFRTAKRALDQAVALATTYRFTAERLRALRALAGMHYRQGDHTTAELLITEVLHSKDVDIDLSNKVDALYVAIGISYYKQNNNTQQLAMEMIDVAHRAHWERGAAYGELELAITVAAEGRIKDAIASALRAVSVCETFHDRREAARCLLALGKMECARYNKMLSIGFRRGVERVKSARDIFIKLRMENEIAEANATLKAVQAVRIGRRLKFIPHHSNAPIGGD
jgi:tetratricopeptide (TPR) repeat protein